MDEENIVTLLGGAEGPLDICGHKLIRPVSRVVIYPTQSVVHRQLGLTKGRIHHVSSMEGWGVGGKELKVNIRK